MIFKIQQEQAFDVNKKKQISIMELMGQEIKSTKEKKIDNTPAKTIKLKLKPLNAFQLY